MANLFQVKSAGSLMGVCCWLLAVSLCEAETPKKPKPKPAKLKVSGYGLIGNFELKRILRTLELGRAKPEFFEASFIEDATLMLGARIKHDGYLKPAIHARLRMSDGTVREVDAADLLEHPLSEGLKIREAHFSVRKGLLY